MMGKSTAITTYLRVRPTKQGGGYFEVDPNDSSRVEVAVPAETATGYVNNKRTNWRFGFDGVHNGPYVL